MLTRKSALILSLVLVLVAFAGLVTPSANAQTSFQISSTGHTETTISLKWNSYNNSVPFGNSMNNYTIYMSTYGTNGPWNEIYVAPPSQLQLAVYSLSPSTDYWFYVVANYGNIFGTGSATSTTYETNTTANPLLYVVTTTQTLVSLTWKDSNSYTQLVPFVNYTLKISINGGPYTTVSNMTNQEDTTYTVFGLTPGTAYSFQVIVYYGPVNHIESATSSPVNAETVTPITVNISASASAITVGQSVQFTALVNGGSPPYTYQWYVNGNPVSGSTDIYTFDPSSSGTYNVYVAVTDSTGTTKNSNTSSITVYSAISVSTSASASAITVGQSVQFTALVNGGSPPYTYQWYVNGNPVSGSTDIYTFNPSSSGTYNVYVAVTDSTGATQNSKTVSITVYSAISVSTSAPVKAITTGQSIQINASASGGNGQFTYQWYVNGNPVSGATSPTFVFKPSSNGTYSIYVTVTDSTGKTSASSPITINVNSASIISPSNQYFVYVLIGIVAIVIIIAVVVAVMVTKRKQKTNSSKPPTQN
jgi:hypothetical protein